MTRVYDIRFRAPFRLLLLVHTSSRAHKHTSAATSESDRHPATLAHLVTKAPVQPPQIQNAIRLLALVKSCKLPEVGPHSYISVRMRGDSLACAAYISLILRRSALRASNCSSVAARSSMR